MIASKISVVIWTAYLLSAIINHHNGGEPSWLMTFIPIICLCVESWLSYIADCIFNNEEAIKSLLNDRYNELFGDDDNEDDEDENK